jgi:hypothetical protein
MGSISLWNSAMKATMRGAALSAQAITVLHPGTAYDLMLMSARFAEAGQPFCDVVI